MSTTATLDRLCDAIEDALSSVALGLAAQLSDQNTGSFALPVPATYRRSPDVSEEGLGETPVVFIYVIDDRTSIYLARRQIVDVTVEIMTAITRANVYDGATQQDMTRALERYQSAIGYALQADMDPATAGTNLKDADAWWMTVDSTRYEPRFPGTEIETSGMLRTSRSRYRFKLVQTSIP